MEKLDVTRDLQGILYAPKNWREKHAELAEVLQDEFGLPFRDNGNSFDSCLQFEATVKRDHLRIRIKFYCKFLAFLQSEGVLKAIGMNTKAIFNPNVRMGQGLLACKDQGLSRIEITYSATCKIGESTLLNTLFYRYAEIDLNMAQTALNKVQGLGWELPMKAVFDSFVEKARVSQILIVQPTLVAMIYATNPKRSCYTGFYRNK